MIPSLPQHTAAPSTYRRRPLLFSSIACPRHRPFAVSTIRAANRLFAQIVAVGNNTGVAVRVSQEVMQGEDTLYETRFEPFPVGGRHDPGDAVDRNNPLVGLVIAINSEDNPLITGTNGSPAPGFTGLRVRKTGSGLMLREAVLSRRPAVRNISP